MAMEVHVNGPALVRIAPAATGVLADLGYTRNGAQLSFEQKIVEIPGDENGGDDGFPIEYQLMGEMCRVRLEFTRWDESVANLLFKRGINAATLGTPSAVGTLVFSNVYDLRLLISATLSADIYNFPRAVALQPIDINKGTKFSSLICDFWCFKSAAGVLWNTTAV